MKKLFLPSRKAVDQTAEKKAPANASLQDKIANFRKATGTLETVEMPFRCSVTGEAAIYVYTRAHVESLSRKFKKEHNSARASAT